MAIYKSYLRKSEVKQQLSKHLSRSMASIIPTNPTRVTDSSEERNVVSAYEDYWLVITCYFSQCCERTHDKVIWGREFIMAIGFSGCQCTEAGKTWHWEVEAGGPMTGSRKQFVWIWKCVSLSTISAISWSFHKLPKEHYHIRTKHSLTGAGSQC